MKTRFLLVFIFFTFTQNIFANELKGFCFRANTSLNRVLVEMKSLSLPKDKFYKRESLNCIEMKISSNRFQMFKTILAKKFHITRTYGGAKSKIAFQEFGKRKNCKIEILKTSHNRGVSHNAGLGENNHLSQSRNKGSRTSSSQIHIAEGMQGHLRVSDSSINIICWPKSGNAARIDVSLASNTSGLSTSINTIRGQRINLGQVVEKLKNKSRDLSIKKGFSYKNQKDIVVTDYFLIYR